MMETEISNCTATLSWTTIVPQVFCEMVGERFPQAWVLVAVYCVLLKRLDEYWCIRGTAKSLLGTVRRELPDGLWEKWLQWPMEEMGDASVNAVVGIDGARDYQS